MVAVRQGDVWWAEADDKRRPVLVVTRSDVIEKLTAIVVAPVSRTIRGIPTEIDLGDAEGLPVPCVATFDNLQLVRPTALTDRLGSLGRRRRAICRALQALADC